MSVLLTDYFGLNRGGTPGVAGGTTGTYYVDTFSSLAALILASPSLTGTPTAPTATALTASTQIATTAYADAATSVEKTRALAAETLLAPLASPTFSGTPTLPTAGAGTNTTQAASTAFVTTAIANAITSAYTSAGGWDASIGTFPSGSVKGGTYLVTTGGTVNGIVFNAGDSLIAYVASASTTTFAGNWVHDIGALSSIEVTTALGYTPAPTISPALTGTPTAPTAAASTNTTQIATTAYADAATLVEKTRALAAEALLAPLASPTLTGTPAAPTATAGTNTTQLATTAFVGTAITAAALTPASVAPLINGTAAVGTSLLYARQDHVHPTDTTRAALASPTFTGTPAAPTAAASTSTTQLATTAFVVGQAATVAPLATAQTAAVGTSLLYARQDHVHKETLTTIALAASTRIITYTDEAGAATALDMSNSAWMKYAVAP